MVRIYILSIILFATFALAIWKPTNAFFTDAAISGGNVFAAASVFPSISQSTSPTTTPTNTPTPSETVTPSPSVSINPTVSPGNIIINEVSPVGAQNLEWIELFNSGGTAVDISGWKIQDNTSSDTFTGNTSINPGMYAVIVASGSGVIVPQSAIKIQLSSSEIGNGLADGGDRVQLLNNSNTIIDELSYGTNTTIHTLNAPSGSNTLRRIPNGLDTNAASNWQIGTSSLGVSN